MARGKHQARRKKESTRPLIVLAVIAAAVAAAIAAGALLSRGKAGFPGSGTQTAGETNGAQTGESASTPSTETAPPATAPATQPEETTAPTEPPVEEYTGPVDPLTGLPTQEDISANRPWAVMINNLTKAVPQAGIGKADVIIEAPVEGGITRLMALYQDMGDLAEIGPVRSARPYYVNIAVGFDAMYIHAGGSDDAYRTMKNTGIDRIDGVNGPGDTFHRDAWRRKNRGYEHSLMLDVPLIDGYAERYNFRTAHKDGYEAPFAFDDREERTGDAAESVEIRFSGGSSKLTSFAFDAQTKLYTVSQYGAVMTDSLTGSAVTVRNVITVKTDITRIPGDSEGRLQAVLAGSGEGLHICDGVARSIRWSRASDTSPWSFTLEDGTPLTLGSGVTYIVLLPKNGTVELG